ncbi:class I SAM-dependent methyltransferase [Paenibacillus pini]|uniref:Methyltransferase Atu1041 n=1 Tax=Paenibacillus pini JCM 16418 TaxID=1236976 RepID=W7YPX9_9BACL|nr:class I SAM-dependent methyltransferase [Paenibacillus pini]GAF06586.1 methyltransferase Atu1041 [Paenibacillus pini JCM 16418]
MQQNLYDNTEFFNMYKNLRETRITYIDFIEQPAIRKLLPPLQNLQVLDLGCGFGEQANYIIDNGATHVTGVDISEKMLGMARKRSEIHYLHSPIEEVDFNNHQFDLVVSSLAFHYIEDYHLLISRITQWIKPNGYLVFSTEHPIVLSNKNQEGWIKDYNNNILHWPIDHYGEEGLRTQFWGIDGVIKYHRKLSTLLNVLIQNGLVIEEIVEPESISEGLEKMPKLINERKRPSFILIKAKRVM